LLHPTQRLLNQVSSKMAQWKLDSQFIKISSNTRVEFTDMFLEVKLVDMQSKLLVGELKEVLLIGSVLTHGILHGV